MLALSDERERLQPGTRVEVRDRFKGAWARGFEVECAEGDHYRIRRLSDGAVLPVAFAPDAVREEHRKHGLWWW